MTAAAAKPERLSREDAARWHMGTAKNPMVIGALLLFEQRLTLEDLDAMVLETMIPQRRFRQHVVESTHSFGRPCWRDDAPFTLRAHVDQLNPSRAVDAAALVRLAGERMNVPLPADRSPWRLELVELAHGGSALLVRIHHCIADGRALVALLHALSGGPRGRGDAATDHQPLTSASPPPPSFGLVRRAGFLAMLASRFRFLALSRDPVSLLRRPLSGEKRVAWSDAIPLDTVKAIARATGHRFIDVLLAGVAGALARYQRDHGQAPRSLRALLPVAVPVAASASRLGNHFASVFVGLPVATVDPMTRVELIARDMLALRGGGALRVAIGLVRLAGSIAPALERWAVRRGARRASLVVSSLAGPTVPLRVADKALTSIVVWAPAAASIGLSLTFFGYAGNLRLGVIADGAVIDRPQELITAFQAALDDLRRGALPGNR